MPEHRLDSYSKIERKDEKRQQKVSLEDVFVQNIPNQSHGESNDTARIFSFAARI